MRASLAAAVCAVLFAGLASACGGGEPPPPSAPSAPTESAAPLASTPPAPTPPAPSASAAPAESAAPPAGGPPKAGEWDTWSHDQKLEYMKTAVMPKMGGLFHDFDAKKYAEPKCVLCHGSAAKDGSFKMPNAELPKLDVTPAGFKAMQAKKPAMVEFMLKQVEPKMAELIGEPAFDPSTKQGFGCMNCHTKKK